MYTNNSTNFSTKITALLLASYYYTSNFPFPQFCIPLNFNFELFLPPQMIADARIIYSTGIKHDRPNKKGCPSYFVTNNA